MKLTDYIEGLKAALTPAYSVIDGTLDEVSVSDYQKTFVCVAESDAEYAPIEAVRYNQITYTVLLGIQVYALDGAAYQARVIRDELVSSLPGVRYGGLETVVTGWRRMESTPTTARYEITINVEEYNET